MLQYRHFCSTTDAINSIQHVYTVKGLIPGKLLIGQAGSSPRCTLMKTALSWQFIDRQLSQPHVLITAARSTKHLHYIPHVTFQVRRTAYAIGHAVLIQKPLKCASQHFFLFNHPRNCPCRTYTKISSSAPADSIFKHVRH